MAVATPKGLVVPVIRNVESKNFADIEIALAALGEKARRNAIAVEDMDGGTFTISNGGVFGSLMGTPIINPPQSAILGMHGIFDRPIAVKGQVSDVHIQLLTILVNKIALNAHSIRVNKFTYSFEKWIYLKLIPKRFVPPLFL